ncbi:hypothetical protein BVY03_04615, partial [bacterium K02(2017)]
MKFILYILIVLLGLINDARAVAVDSLSDESLVLVDRKIIVRDFIEECLSSQINRDNFSSWEGWHTLVSCQFYFGPKSFLNVENFGSDLETTIDINLPSFPTPFKAFLILDPNRNGRVGVSVKAFFRGPVFIEMNRLSYTELLSKALGQFDRFHIRRMELKGQSDVFPKGRQIRAYHYLEEITVDAEDLFRRCYNDFRFTIQDQFFWAFPDGLDKRERWTQRLIGRCQLPNFDPAIAYLFKAINNYNKLFTWKDITIEEQTLSIESYFDHYLNRGDFYLEVRVRRPADVSDPRLGDVFTHIHGLLEPLDGHVFYRMRLKWFPKSQISLRPVFRKRIPRDLLSSESVLADPSPLMLKNLKFNLKSYVDDCLAAFRWHPSSLYSPALSRFIGKCTIRL